MFPSTCRRVESIQTDQKVINTFITVDHFTTLVNKLYFASSTGVHTTFCFRMGGAGGPLTEVA